MSEKGSSLTQSQSTPPRRDRTPSPANKKKTHVSSNVTAARPVDTGSYLRRMVSVRTIAAAMCFLLILITVVIVLLVTFTFSLDAAKDIASQHALVISSKAKGDVEDFLNVPLRYARGWQYTLAQGNHPLPSDNHATLWAEPWWERLVAPMAATDFLFQYAVLGFENGNYAGCNLVLSDTFQCQQFTWGDRDASNTSDASDALRRDFNQSDYSLITETDATTTYDPRARSWYIGADKNPKALSWNDVILTAQPTLPVINVNIAIHNNSGTLLGIGTLTFGLTTLSSLLAALIATDNTVSVLLDNDGLLIASSYAEPFLKTTEISATYTGTVDSNCLRSDSANDADLNIIVCRDSAASYGYAPLNQLLQADPELVTNGRANVSSVYELGGKRFYVAVVPIETPRASGMGWRFVLLMPEDDIIDGIVKGRNLSIYICIGVVGLAVIIALVVITLLLRPLDAVADRMYRVAMMQDVDDSDEEDDGVHEFGSTKRAEPTKSVLYEIATIQTAFSTMTSELAKIKSFLPQSVLAQLYGMYEDEDVGSEMGTHGNETTSVGYNGQNTVRSAGSNQLSSSHKMQSVLSSGGSGSNVAPGHGLNTAVNLSTRNVTMLCLNVLGYHKHTFRRPTADTMRQHGMIVKTVSVVCSEHRGVMDGFQGDRFTISFNAVTNAGGHAVLAARTARAISEAVSSRTPLTVSAGIASGSAMVGNMGSATTKRFTVLSHVVSSAVLLERLSKRYSSMLGDDPVALVGGSSAQDDIEHVFDTLVVDAVMLPTLGGDTKRSRVCAVMGAKKAAADEWMYEMQEATNKSKYGAVNAAFTMFLDGMVAEAGAAISHEQSLNGAVNDPEGRVVNGVLRHIDDLVTRANGHSDSTEYGRTYANDLTDYYTKCALPHRTSHDGVTEIQKIPSLCNSDC